MYFVIIFTNYSLLLKGLITKDINIKNIIYISFFLIITMIISYMILGVPRLYFIWFILTIKYIHNGLHIFKYDIKKTYDFLLWIIETDHVNNLILIDNLGYDRLINTKGFNYGFLEFIDYTRKNSAMYYPLHIKSPFIYYERKMLLLTFFRVNFQKLMYKYEYISNEYYNSLFEFAEKELDMKNDEKVYMDKKLKKIYKKYLKNL